MPNGRSGSAPREIIRLVNWMMSNTASTVMARQCIFIVSNWHSRLLTERNFHFARGWKHNRHHSWSTFAVIMSRRPRHFNFNFFGLVPRHRWRVPVFTRSLGRTNALGIRRHSVKIFGLLAWTTHASPFAPALPWDVVSRWSIRGTSTVIFLYHDLLIRNQLLDSLPSASVNVRVNWWLNSFVFGIDTFGQVWISLTAFLHYIFQFLQVNDQEKIGKFLFRWFPTSLLLNEKSSCCRRTRPSQRRPKLIRPSYISQGEM